jgi:hypothetical protein
MRSSGRAVSGCRFALSVLSARAVSWRVPGAPLNAGVRWQICNIASPDGSTAYAAGTAPVGSAP